MGAAADEHVRAEKHGLRVSLVKEPILVGVDENDQVGDEEYFLSNLDQNIAVVMKTVYFFQAKDTQDDPAEVLRKGLSKVLLHYYPLAGRLGVSREGKLHVVFKNQGVVFVEAEADIRICDLGEVIKPDASLIQLVYSFPGAKHVLEVPPMTVQVTKFKCGGFVLGLCINHCMFDGIGAMEFVHAWTEMSRGVPLSTVPFLDRSILKARDTPCIQFPHLEYAQVEDVGMQPSLHFNNDVEYRAFSVRAEQLEQLKHKIVQEGVLTRCTTFEALSSVVWRCRTKALAMHSNQKSKLLFAVDYRSRLQPPLPKGYMGNGIMLTYAIATAGEIVNKSLSELVCLVREAIARVDDTYIRSSIDCFEVQRFCPSLFATLLVSTWSRLSFHTTDFGWGEPLHSGPVGFPEPEVCLFLSHGKDRHNVNLILGFRPEPMKRFHNELEDILGEVICSS